MNIFIINHKLIKYNYLPPKNYPNHKNSLINHLNSTHLPLHDQFNLKQYFINQDH